MLTTIVRIGKLETGREVQLVPFFHVLSAVIIPCLEVVASVEIEFPAVFAKRISSPAAASAIANMVINDAVVNECASPFVEACFGITSRIGNRYELTFLDVLGPAY